MSMRNLRLLLFILLFCSPGLEAQYRLVGGPCEGCEAVFEYGDRSLTPVDTLPDFNGEGQRIRVSGRVYQPDGTSPAEGVILYVYHTNGKGVYPTRGNEQGWARRHGYIRGWVQTGADGSYSFYTQKPGSYSSEPAHIHITILEPNGKYYWLGSYRFEGDPHLESKHRNAGDPRGGSNGILSLRMKDGIWFGQRDIVLGRNVEGYR